jgi:hypothetical protein
MKKTCFLLISLLIYSSNPLHAQENATGQICLRAFEDLNHNQIRDQAEFPVQANLIANLLDSEGVVIASERIEDSPTRSQGLICFRDLAPNTYTISGTSAGYLATTSDQLTATLTEGDLPVVFDFGGQPLVATTQAETNENAPITDPTVERFVVASIGAFIAMVIWMTLGGLILLILIRPRTEHDEADHQTDSRFTPPTDPNALFKPPPAPDIDETYEL